ncbi:1-acyl-sn-glycerol-3-phosphate acyltransferase [Bacillus mesophilus]|uniref:1-acyl-sn-glycerol-3-phosphate acyltransferase n=1 Tax=Bacillus mesophilus TaxID=1808955 RepID=A0A6M0QA13_9BACI|nr:lysophospholipid acyltransferase family protein [Bacillus mesophilus]MBM7662076.1 1-acyl-sn-glycerol-3-phosphate acyltransferase [Bacillus mesophilus]NEY72569.1 1-acyl-sn-glycerol-3-phosphate acyltransferase [Bacillus mesophilus]
MVYQIVRSLVRWFLHIRFNVTVKGKENIPEGAVILAMNHQTNWDSLLAGTHTPRKMYIMAKESLFRKKIFAWLITEMGAFPVNREKADIKSLKHTLKLLKDEKIFSLFIEGSRSETEDMQDPKKGVGFIVSKSKAPVVPTYIYGVRNTWGGNAGVVFGKPMYFEGELDYEEISKQVATGIKKLKENLPT